MVFIICFTPFFRQIGQFLNFRNEIYKTWGFQQYLAWSTKVLKNMSAWCVFDKKKFPLWINKCHIFAHFLHFWPCYFFSNLFYGRQPMWHEKLVVICLIANFLNFHFTKSNFPLVAIYSIKGHLDYLFRIEEVYNDVISKIIV